MIKLQQLKRNRVHTWANSITSVTEFGFGSSAAGNIVGLVYLLDMSQQVLVRFSLSFRWTFVVANNDISGLNKCTAWTKVLSHFSVCFRPFQSHCHR